MTDCTWVSIKTFEIVMSFLTVVPYMVLEFCELGRLDIWLKDKKNLANEETSEQLCRICYGICKGMLHFESRKVTNVHDK